MTLDDLRAQQARRRRFLHLTLTCLALLALVALVVTGPSDAVIAGGVR